MLDEKKNACVWKESAARDCKRNVTECDPTTNDGKLCPVWTRVRLQTKVHKKLASWSLICGFFCEMPAEHKKTSALIDFDPDDGKIHVMQCDATANDGKLCHIAPYGRQYGFKRKFKRKSLQSFHFEVPFVQQNVSRETCLQGTLQVDAKEQ